MRIIGERGRHPDHHEPEQNGECEHLSRCHAPPLPEHRQQRRGERGASHHAGPQRGTPRAKRESRHAHDEHREKRRIRDPLLHE
jgi:hypothetical protein